MNLTPEERPDDPEAEARKLIAEGWWQTSRCYQMVCRLPEGKTGVEALIEAEAKQTRRSLSGVHNERERIRSCGLMHQAWAQAMGERDAASHFMRMHATCEEGLCRVLDSATFKWFKKLGGVTA